MKACHIEVFLLFLFTGAGVWYHLSRPAFEPAAVTRMTYPLPEKPSITVLPFENLSDDAQMAFFASGMTEDLTAALARVPELFVIAKSSAATYKGKPIDIKQVAEEQSVQYEAKRGWSASREKSILSGMALAQRSIQMDPESPLGYQTLGNLYALTGQAAKAIALRRKAAQLAPNDLVAVAGLATRLKDFGGAQEAVELFEQAMRLSPKPPWWVPSAYGVALHLVGRKKEAVVSFKKAIALKPRHVHPQAFFNRCLY